MCFQNEKKREREKEIGRTVSRDSPFYFFVREKEGREEGKEKGQRRDGRGLFAAYENFLRGR